MTALRIIAPESTAAIAAFRALNWDYRAYLMGLPPPHSDAVTAAYPKDAFQKMLDAGAVDNRPPNGRMRLMLKGDAPVGCGTLHTLAPGDGEIKRVYIAEAARGLGAGRMMMEQLIADARALGLNRVLMDTGVALEPAWKLYDAMGFRRRGPYLERQEPLADLLIFYEMDLG